MPTRKEWQKRCNELWNEVKEFESKEITHLCEAAYLNYQSWLCVPILEN